MAKEGSGFSTLIKSGIRERIRFRFPNGKSTCIHTHLINNVMRITNR